MRYKANEVMWDIIKVKNKICFFCDFRIDRKSVPEDFDMYEVADNDCDGIPCYFAKGILVNFYGTIITKERIEFDDRYCDIEVGEREGQSSRYFTLSEILKLFERGELQ